MLHIGFSLYVQLWPMERSQFFDAESLDHVPYLEGRWSIPPSTTKLSSLCFPCSMSFSPLRTVKMQVRVEFQFGWYSASRTEVVGCSENNHAATLTK